MLLLRTQVLDCEYVYLTVTLCNHSDILLNNQEEKYRYMYQLQCDFFFVNYVQLQKQLGFFYLCLMEIYIQKEKFLLA